VTKPTLAATTFTASPLPEEVNGWYHYEVTAEYVGSGRWAVRHQGHQCLNRSGEWVWEMQPSSRTDEWLVEHRFSEEEAKAHALEQCLLVEVNGRTAAQWFAQWSQMDHAR
jgi:hypothetical protein